MGPVPKFCQKKSKGHMGTFVRSVLRSIRNQVSSMKGWGQIRIFEFATVDSSIKKLAHDKCGMRN